MMNGTVFEVDSAKRKHIECCKLMRKYVYTANHWPKYGEFGLFRFVDEIDINRNENSSLTNYVNDIKPSVYLDRFIHCIFEFRRPTHYSHFINIGIRILQSSPMDFVTKTISMDLFVTRQT